MSLDPTTVVRVEFRGAPVTVQTLQSNPVACRDMLLLLSQLLLERCAHRPMADAGLERLCAHLATIVAGEARRVAGPPAEILPFQTNNGDPAA
jgi:hypothetical protein